MLGGKDHYAIDMVFLFVALFTDRSNGSEANCDLTRVNVQYIDTENKMVVDRREVRRVERELVQLRSEIEDLKRAVRKAFAPHCTSGLYYNPDVQCSVPVSGMLI